MKKLFPLMVVAVAATMFTSCKKDYTCTCTVNQTIGGTQTYTIPYTNVSKSDAKDACKASEAIYANAGTASCKL